MQTRTYGDLFKLVQSLAGVTAFATNEQDDIANLINRRFQVAYNTSPIWPRYIVSSEGRDINAYTLSGATASTSTSVNQNYKFLGSNDGNVGTSGTNVYQGVTTSTVVIYKDSNNAWKVDTAASATIQSDGNYRVVAGTNEFIEADTLKKDVLENVTTWTPRAGSDVLLVEPKNLIPYVETGKDTIGEFIRIHRNQAFLNKSTIEYDFFVDVTGGNLLNISSSSDNKAFITYKKTLTLFTTSSSYTTSSEEVPGEFFDYIAYGTYADFLRMDGQHDKAQLESENAEVALALQLERVDAIMNNNTINKRFSTYVNRQSR
tara:strand:- start:89 stop:1042 length:954 start_codon:yes stop_codon:yes gene_type:complete